MSSWRPAHSPKDDVPTSREQVELELLYDWKWRKALWRMGSFRAVDPLPAAQRERASWHLEREGRFAAIFLACRTARAKYPRAGLIMNNDPVEISPSAGIPPGVYTHVGGGRYMRKPRPELRVIPGGRS